MVAHSTAIKPTAHPIRLRLGGVDGRERLGFLVLRLVIFFRLLIYARCTLGDGFSAAALSAIDYSKVIATVEPLKW